MSAVEPTLPRTDEERHKIPLRRHLPPLPKARPWYTLTTAERVERWQNVVRVLESLDKHQRTKHFSMRNWSDITECGTIACAAGWCGFDPWFHSQGFAMRLFRYPPPPFSTDSGVEIDYELGDVEEFFGTQGSGIFYDSTARSFEKVLEEIREYLAKLSMEAA